MIQFLIIALAAFSVSWISLPLIRRIAISCGAVSEVGGRHIGNEPIGRLGGLGVLLGISIAIGLQIHLNPNFGTLINFSQTEISGLLIGLVLVGGVGFLDDVRRLPARTKLAVQFVAALVACKSKLVISVVDLPFFDPFPLGWFCYPVTIVWIVGIVNAVNLIDGLDGLAGGIVLFASIVNFLAALGVGAFLPAILMAALFGATLGFLVHNWYPARIYLGDGGAYALGFLLAVCGLLAPVQKMSTGVGMLVPILAVGLPIFDTVLTMVRRFLLRRAIFSPDRGHLHHLLLDAGISHRRVVVGLYSICCVLCSVALLLVLNRYRHIGVVLVVVSVVGFLVWGRLVNKQLKIALNRMLNIESPKNGRTKRF